MKEENIVEIWALFREYLDKKQQSVVAEKYVDLLADYGVSDEIFEECIGGDDILDDAIEYYLDDDSDDDEAEWE